MLFQVINKHQGEYRMPDIWFWQLIISPHMADLAVALAKNGCKVTYVVQQEMSVDRAQQGWVAPPLPGVKLYLATSKKVVIDLVRLSPRNAIHICQGVRANYLVGVAQRELAKLQLRQWAIMETVDDSGWRGVLKRIEYNRIFRTKGKSLQGVLATGHKTGNWVIAKGIDSKIVFPFAYFLPNHTVSIPPARRTDMFRFAYVGRLVPGKRVDWLIKALESLSDKKFELSIVGAGPEEHSLRSLASRKLAGRVHWLGQLPLTDVPAIMSQVDCLVLPSKHDGWGAVASEAMMAGTPVICSDACGVAGAVKSSHRGGVFPANNISALGQLLAKQLEDGVVSDESRCELAAWAKCLDVGAGATYLQNILTFNGVNIQERPIAPWDD